MYITISDKIIKTDSIHLTAELFSEEILLKYVLWFLSFFLKIITVLLFQISQE